MDQNCYLVNWVRALNRRSQAVLGHLPDKAAGVQPGRVFRFDTLELALAEAWVAGGNYALALEPRFSEALLNGTDAALTAWRNLGRTAKWLRTNIMLFRQRPLPLFTVLVDSGEQSLEIANLCYRFNVSPALAAANDPPAPNPGSRLVLSAAGIDTPNDGIRHRILAHAVAGTTVVVDAAGPSAWWRTEGMRLLRADPDREFFGFGKGQVVAYKEPVVDPGEYAQDLIDIAGQKRRTARLWNCDAGVAIATSAPRVGPMAGNSALHIINYGQPVEFPVLARIDGVFTRAIVVRPEAGPQSLKVGRRGSASEVAVDHLGRLATVIFT
jgi:hypothetical protein